jgi:hypothetical protein
LIQVVGDHDWGSLALRIDQTPETKDYSGTARIIISKTTRLTRTVHIHLENTTMMGRIYDIVSLAHNVSFWTQKTLK